MLESASSSPPHDTKAVSPQAIANQFGKTLKGESDGQVQLQAVKAGELQEIRAAIHQSAAALSGLMPGALIARRRCGRKLKFLERDDDNRLAFLAKEET
jgi:hypothetical protein